MSQKKISVMGNESNNIIEKLCLFENNFLKILFFLSIKDGIINFM